MKHRINNKELIAACLEATKKGVRPKFINLNTQPDSDSCTALVSALMALKK